MRGARREASDDKHRDAHALVDERRVDSTRIGFNGIVYNMPSHY